MDNSHAVMLAKILGLGVMSTIQIEATEARERVKKFVSGLEAELGEARRVLASLDAIVGHAVFVAKTVHEAKVYVPGKPLQRSDDKSDAQSPVRSECGKADAPSAPAN